MYFGTDKINASESDFGVKRSKLRSKYAAKISFRVEAYSTWGLVSSS